MGQNGGGVHIFIVIHAHVSLVKSKVRERERERASLQLERYLSEFEGAVRVERRDLAGVFGDVTIKARRRVHEVLHVFIDALHFPLKQMPDTTLSVASTLRA